MNSLIWCLLVIICIYLGNTRAYEENTDDACFQFKNEFQCNGKKHIGCYWKDTQCMTPINDDIHIIFIIGTIQSHDTYFEVQIRELISSKSLIAIFYHDEFSDPSLFTQNSTLWIINTLNQINTSQHIFFIILNGNDKLLCALKPFMDSIVHSAVIILYETQFISRDISCVSNIHRVYVFDIIESNQASIISKISWDLHNLSLPRRQLLDASQYEADFVNSNCVDLKDILDIIFLIDNSCGLTDAECYIQSQGILDLILSVKVNDIYPRIGIIHYGNTSQIVYTLSDNNITQLLDIFTNYTCSAPSIKTDLAHGIQFARTHFEVMYRSTDIYHKLVIISNCMDYDIDNVCTQVLDIFNNESISIDTIAININVLNSDISNLNTYLDCITDIIYPITSLQPSAFDDIISDVSNDICAHVGHDNDDSDDDGDIPPMSLVHPTTESPSIPTYLPTYDPTIEPTIVPSNDTTYPPTDEPTPNPTRVSGYPTASPAKKPISIPHVPTRQPTTAPSNAPSLAPTLHPTEPPTTHQPTLSPSVYPTHEPTIYPTNQPTHIPSNTPSLTPTIDPTLHPSINPSNAPTLNPSFNPSVEPTLEPTSNPSIEPTIEPTPNPSVSPTEYPTSNPSTYEPTSSAPTTSAPTTSAPTTSTPTTSAPTTSTPTTSAPTTSIPTESPSDTPTSPIPAPTKSISIYPTVHKPTPSPTMNPTKEPSPFPTIRSSYKPSHQPITTPSPSLWPTQWYIPKPPHTKDCTLPYDTRPCYCFKNKKECQGMDRTDCAWQYADDQYIVITESKSWLNAETYCLEHFGTHLATIIDDGDMNEAVYTALDADMVWIGLFNDIERCSVSSLDCQWVNFDGNATRIGVCNTVSDGDIQWSYIYQCKVNGDGVLQNWYRDNNICDGDIHKQKDMTSQLTDFNCVSDKICTNYMKIKTFDSPKQDCIQNEDYYQISELIINQCFRGNWNQSKLIKCGDTNGYIIEQYHDSNCKYLWKTEQIPQKICGTTHQLQEVQQCISNVECIEWMWIDGTECSTHNPINLPAIPTVFPTWEPSTDPTSSPTVTPEKPVTSIKSLDAAWVNVNGRASPIGSCNVWQHGVQVRSYMYSCDDDDGAVQHWFMNSSDCSGTYYSQLKPDIIDYRCDSDNHRLNILIIKQYNRDECHLRIQNELYYIQIELVVDHCIADNNNSSYLYECSSSGGYIIHTYDDKYCIELRNTQSIDNKQCINDKIEHVLQCNSDNIVQRNNDSIDISILGDDTEGMITNPIVCWSNINQPFYAGYYDMHWNGIPGDVCDHIDSGIGEMRDSCYFEVKLGEQKWKRSCIHRSLCPNNGEMGCITDSREIKCCCDDNYCNEYMNAAMQGFTFTSSRHLLSMWYDQDGPCTTFWRNDVVNNECAVLSVKDNKFIALDCDETHSFLCNNAMDNSKICRSSESLTTTITSSPSRIQTPSPKPPPAPAPTLKKPTQRPIRRIKTPRPTRRIKLNAFF